MAGCAHGPSTATCNVSSPVFPATALSEDGARVLLAQATAEQVLILDPVTQQPRILPMADFATIGTGRPILPTRRASQSDLGRHFDIHWFLGESRHPGAKQAALGNKVLSP
jgi:ATP-binding cassette, subfamily B, bacterial HlyB/CyaB